MTNFNYAQQFQRRVINDPSLERFTWELHSVDTEYKEPFTHANITSKSSQTYVPDKALRPLRLFNLSFSGFILYDSDVDSDDYPTKTSFNALYNFFKRHGTYKYFIYEHPIYGDLVVRFGKTLSIPKKNPSGGGSLFSFDIQFIEKITTHYLFYKDESLSGELPFHPAYYDVEVDITEDTIAAPLGGNYEMIFKRAKKPLRTYKITLWGLRYFFDEGETLSAQMFSGENMLLLELFYLKYRLNKRFVFNYLGEEIPVRFQEPIKIPKVEGNTGVLGTVELLLIETPYETLWESESLKVT